MSERCADRKCAKPTARKFRLEVMRDGDWAWVVSEIGLCQSCAERTLTHHQNVFPAEYRLAPDVVTAQVSLESRGFAE